MDPGIAEYILANRRKYTRQAITQQLEEAGHARADIDATWEALFARDPDEVAGEAFWGRFWIFLIGLNLAALLLVGFLTGMLTGSGGIVVLVILGVVLAIGALIAWAIVAATHPTQMGRGTAMAVGALVPLLFTFLIAGSCYALVGGLSGGSGQPAQQGTMTLEVGPPIDFGFAGQASCFPYGGGFTVFAEQLGMVDGRALSVSIEGSVAPADVGPGPTPVPGGKTPTSLFISLVPRTEADAPVDWHSGPGTTLDLSVEAGGLSGAGTFDSLTPSLEFDPDTEPISGSLSWDCR